MIRNRDVVDATKKSIRKCLKKGNAKLVAEREDYLAKRACEHRKLPVLFTKLVPYSTTMKISIITTPTALKAEIAPALF